MTSDALDILPIIHALEMVEENILKVTLRRIYTPVNYCLQSLRTLMSLDDFVISWIVLAPQMVEDNIFQVYLSEILNPL